MAFTKRTFELLSQLKKSGKYSFFQESEHEFTGHLVQPFQELLRNQVLPLLPEHITASLNTTHRIFGQINKNDFGQGGANPFYWGAFYPQRSTNKQQDAQLLTFIAPQYLEFGFFFGWQTSEEHLKQFQENVRKIRRSEQDYELLLTYLEASVPGDSIVVREQEYNPATYVTGEHGTLVHKKEVYDWKLLFDRLVEIGVEEVRQFSPMVVLNKAAVLEIPTEELADIISSTFIGMFPLIALTTAQLPVPATRDFIAAQHKDDAQQESGS